MTPADMAPEDRPSGAQNRADPARIHARRWAILAVLNLSLVLIVAGNASLNVALPSLVRELDASHSELQWMVDSYALVFAGLLLPMGALGDRFGRKGMLQVGLAIFAVAALFATLSTQPWHVVSARAVMGFGAAMIMPATLSIVSNVFPPHERAKAIAIWAGFAGAGAAVGPLTSGWLLEHFWVGSIFLINVPTVVAALVAGAFLVPTSRDPDHKALDPAGGLLSMVGLGLLLFAIIQAPEEGWTAPIILGAFAASVTVLAAFVVWERRTPHPMLPIDQFRDARFSMGAGAIGLTFLAMFGFFFVATQFLQFVLGYTPLEAGAATLPMAVMMVIAAPRSAAMSERIGRRRTMATGLVLVAGGMALMSTLSPASAYLNLVPVLALLGAGMGLTMAPATGAIMESMPLAKAGVGSAVNDTTREVGGSLGVAVLGSLLSSGYRSALDVDLSQTPAAAADLARDGVGGALAVAQQMPGPLGDAFAASAQQAFSDAMGAVFLGGAAIVLVTAGLVLRFMPKAAPSHEAHPSDVMASADVPPALEPAPGA